MMKGCAAVLNDKSSQNALCKTSNISLTTVASTHACPTFVMWLSCVLFDNDIDFVGYFTGTVVSGFAAATRC